MRLQILIQRNALPPIRNIFNTTSSTNTSLKPIHTVADLLTALDAVIPIESDHWGFEDYAVEACLNDNQESYYEVFHWQVVSDVFKEDDELRVRPLTAKEMKERRSAGRYQISRDGEYFIDGGRWGRDFVAGHPRRPRVYIPPRSSGKTLTNGNTAEVEDENEAPFMIEGTPKQEKKQKQIRWSVEDDDDDDDSYEDEDFKSGADHSSEDSLEAQAEREAVHALETKQKDRTVSFELQGSDGDDDGDDDGDEDYDDDAEERTEPEAEDEDEVQNLLEDAQAAGIDLEERKRKRNIQTQSPRKRRRQDAAEEVLMDAVMEQPSPHKKRQGHPSANFFRSYAPELAEPVAVINGTSTHVETVENEDATSSSGSSSDSDSDDESSEDDDASDADEAPEVLPIARQVSADTSSSGSDSEDTSDDDSDSSSNSSSSDGESSSASKVSQDSVRSRTKENVRQGSKTDQHERASANGLTGIPESDRRPLQQSENGLSTNATSAKPTVPPGKGQNKTRRNNERKKLNKIMARLKEEGKIHKDANFDQLRAYLQSNGEEDTSTVVEQKEEHVAPDEGTAVQEEADELKARRDEIFRRLNAIVSVPLPFEAEANEDAILDVEEDKQKHPLVEVIEETDSPIAAAMPTEEQALEPKIQHTEPAIVPQPDEPSPKRSRLDVAGSRRLLFGALGVRTPKTAAQEEALRERLSKPTRQLKPKDVDSPALTEPEPELVIPSHDRWKNKLVVKAVECVAKNRHCEVPPFPFKHPWQVRKDKERSRADRRHQQHEDTSHVNDDQQAAEEEHLNTQEVEMDYGDNPSQAVTTSRTVTTGSQHEMHEQRQERTDEADIPIPSDFDVLFDLKEQDLVSGTVIAYKELHVGQNFQPEQSPYRVARILSVENNELRLKLAPQFREGANAEYDEETGERVYGKLEMPGDDDEEPDDGLREMKFDNLIAPKFVAPSDSAEIIIARSQQSVIPGWGSAVDPSNDASLEGGQVADSALEDSATSKIAETQPEAEAQPEVEVSSQRRKEINGIIKEAGFESALDDQLLQSLTEEPEAAARQLNDELQQAEDSLSQSQQLPHISVTETPMSTQQNGWRSSSNPTPSSPLQLLPSSGALRESSVPSESMVESVRYPNLSQLGLDTPAPSAQPQSSSHQDAQRLTPTPLVDIDTSGLLPTIRQADHDIDNDHVSSANHEQDIESESLPSEVPQTQPESEQQEQASDDHSTPRNPRKRTPSPFVGLDRSTSPPPASESDDESVDSLGFPSVRFLTSSQPKRGSKSTSSQPSSSKAPPSTAPQPSSSKLKIKREHPTRKSPRMNKSKDESQVSTNYSDDEETGPASQSQPTVKHSASQRQRDSLRLSQIPEDDVDDDGEQERIGETIVVDLTQSSPAHSPDKPRPAAKKERKSSGASSQQGTGAGLFKRGLEGLGQRNLWKGKKDKDKGKRHP